MMGWAVLGVGLVGVSLAAHLWVRRREFYRRTAHGDLAFETFRASAKFSLANRVLILVGRLALLLGLGLLLAVLLAPPEAWDQPESRHFAPSQR